MSRSKNEKKYKGHKFGHLVLEEERQSVPNYGRMWLCRCDCGETKLIALKNVTSGRVQTCGNCLWHHQLKSNSAKKGVSVSAGEQKLFQRYLRKATRGGRKWLLSTLEFREIVARACDLCGYPAKNKLKGTSYLHSYVGLVDSFGDYTPENTLPLCRKCSLLKGPRNLQWILDRIEAILKNWRFSRTEENISSPSEKQLTND